MWERSWTDGSAVRSTGSSSREPRVQFPAPPKKSIQENMHRLYVNASMFSMRMWTSVGSDVLRGCVLSGTASAGILRENWSAMLCLRAWTQSREPVVTHIIIPAIGRSKKENYKAQFGCLTWSCLKKRKIETQTLEPDFQDQVWVLLLGGVWGQIL